jgi:alkylhydroperoxidase/carboxymuconolactone decarboxylase family protein YurZ
MALRREIVGPEHVEKLNARRTPFNSDYQDLVTRFAFDEVWARPGLDRRTRSCITIAMLIALNRPDELAIHIGAAHRNGVTEDELRELLIHSAIYCGMPAARTAFNIAQDVLE